MRGMSPTYGQRVWVHTELYDAHAAQRLTLRVLNFNRIDMFICVQRAFSRFWERSLPFVPFGER